jgi:hypothetical protein
LFIRMAIPPHPRLLSPKGGKRRSKIVQGLGVGVGRNPPLNENSPSPPRGRGAGSEGKSLNANDFRRMALSLEGAEEGSHMGSVDFRVGGRIFATLAHAEQGYGNLMLTPELQAEFVEELPEVFVPVHGAGAGWEPLISGWPRPVKTCWRAPCTRHGSSAWTKMRTQLRQSREGKGNAARVLEFESGFGLKS